LVSCGTFEYFTQEELQELLLLIQNKPLIPCAIALCEPINIDLNNSMDSMPRGNIAYSHNYPYLLNKLKYQIFHQEIIPIDPNVPFYNCLNMIATT
jgi:hypothetical protein